MSIKTLHLTNCWHNQSGGIATFYRELLNAAERFRRPIRLVVPADRDSVEQSGAYGKIYRINGPLLRLSPGYRVILPQRYLVPREPFGIAPLEAMASGLALVAPYTGGVRHYADSSNAWLAEPNPESFAKAVQVIRNDPAARQARHCAARATAERFDWEKVTAGYFDLYDDLHALVRDRQRTPALAPSFYSTPGRRATMEKEGVAR